jgi:hypothetical protein
LEIHNELERRKRTKEIGSLSTCTDAQLQHVIRINTTHIKLNAVVTRDSNKRRESTPNESQLSTLTKRTKSKPNKGKKAPIGAQEHKDNFETEDASTELNKHKYLFKATLAIIEKEKTIEQKIVPSTEQPKKLVTQTTEEFRVTKKDYDKVLKDLLRVRPSRTEQEKALNEQALRERKCNQADEQATLEEKRRRKIEKKKRSREKKLLRLVQRSDGVPRQIAQEMVAEITEEQKKMDIEHTLETYDQYVHQNYYDPDTDELMEIINVYCDKETGAYMSTARVMNYDLGEPDFELKTRRINGPDGTKYLVNLATTGRHGKNDFKWPQNAEEWLQLQLKDAW